MKLYLSSYNLGSQPELLAELFGENKQIGHIINALDCCEIDEEYLLKTKKAVEEIGLAYERLDLKDYFGQKDKLQEKLESLGGVLVNGGNTFVLRQAMALSGFDELFWELLCADFVYAGWSAGICVLAPSLDGLQHVDDDQQFPYEEIFEPLYEGLGYLDYLPLPHYKSDHEESELIDKEVEYCIENKILFKTLRDGEVIIYS